MASLFVHAFLSFRLDHVYSEVQVHPSVKSLSNYCSLIEVFLLKMLKVPLAYQKTTFRFHLSRGICWGLCFSEAVLLWPGVPCLALLCCSQRVFNGFLHTDDLASFTVGGSELFGERNASDLILTSGAPPDVRSLFVSA